MPPLRGESAEDQFSVSAWGMLPDTGKPRAEVADRHWTKIYRSLTFPFYELRRVRANRCPTTAPIGCYFFFRLPEDLLLGTLPPARRASDNPIAIACFRLLTFLPDRPLFKVPLLRSRIALLTLRDAVLPYLAITVPPLRLSSLQLRIIKHFLLMACLLNALCRYRLLQNTFATNGIVLIAPIRNTAQPTAFRWSSLSLSASSRPSPAPSTPLVPAINAISGSVSSAFFIPPPDFIVALEEASSSTVTESVDTNARTLALWEREKRIFRPDCAPV